VDSPFSVVSPLRMLLPASSPTLVRLRSIAALVVMGFVSTRALASLAHRLL
jgi:hypothetical protein